MKAGEQHFNRKMGKGHKFILKIQKANKLLKRYSTLLKKNCQSDGQK